MTVRSDQRSIPAENRPDLHRQAKACWRDALEHQLKLAALFGALLDSREYVHRGAATLVEYARRLGHHGARAIVLARLGQAIELRPDLAEGLRAGRIPLENAEAIARVVVDESYRDLEDWILLAESTDHRSLRGFVRRRIEEAEQQEKDLRLIQLFLTARAEGRLDRVRRIVSRQAGRTATVSQAVEAACEEFLGLHDPETRAAERTKARAGTSSGAKRQPPPAITRDGGRARTRRVPTLVADQVRTRARHRCELPGCTNSVGLQLCHLRWFSRGGCHHPSNLVLLCGRHHVLLDSGVILCLGFSDAGRPVFRMPDGEVLSAQHEVEGPGETGPPAL